MGVKIKEYCMDKSKQVFLIITEKYLSQLFQVLFYF